MADLGAERRVFVIIPAFNEAAGLSQILPELIKTDYRPVVIDDGSSDQTADVARELGVTVLRHSINLGQGAALETGMDYCRQIGAEYVVHFDADAQHRVADIAAVLKPLFSDEADLVLGSRFLEETSRAAIPVSRRRWLQLARVFQNWTTGIKLTDAHNGLRGLNRRALEAIHLRQRGMAHASEILQIAQKGALRIKEVPVLIRYPDLRNSGSQRVIQVIGDLIFSRWAGR